MSLLHNKGSLSDQYIDTFIPALKDNALQGMQVIINYMKEAGHTFPAEMDKYTQVILEATDLKPDIAKAITDLWKNVDFQVLDHQHHQRHQQYTSLLFIHIPLYDGFLIFDLN